MKVFILSFLVLFLVSYSNAQSSSTAPSDSIKAKQPKEEPERKKKKNVSNKAYVMRSHVYLNDIAKLEEGYTPSEGGRYAIKDYIVKGPLNLICVTYGVALASGNINGGESSKRYYLQKAGDDNSYREVFLTKKSGAVPVAAKVLGGMAQTYNGVLNTRRSTGAMVEVSKATLTEMMADNKQVVAEIAKLEKVTSGKMKKLVKAYNAK
ncbi:MAG: hypothetical protein H7Y13_02800 [Sphingobacteriaceae bacterium]|nr:hypothetical protein [Sphingobacteriaceae bacterium]